MFKKLFAIIPLSTGVYYSYNFHQNKETWKANIKTKLSDDQKVDNLLDKYYCRTKFNSIIRKKISYIDFDSKQANNLTPTFLCSYFEDVLIGGSFGLKLFTGLDFATNNVDIFVSAPVGNFDDATCMKVVYSRISSLYENPMPINQDPHATPFQIKMAMDDKQSNEFDKAIVGTINFTTKSNVKTQIVVVNPTKFKNGDTVAMWFASLTDLPVFLDMTHNRWVIIDKTKCDLAKQKILTDINHDYRKEKYEQKGFILI
jgi:hypothetical protein